MKWILRLAVALMGSGWAGPALTATTQMTTTVVGSGGGVASSGPHGLAVTLGQPGVGPALAATQAGVGFWYLQSSNPVTAVDEPEVRPAPLGLEPNTPNPFNPTTTIRFHLPQDGAVALEVFDLRGRAVTTLVDRDLPAGAHALQFHATELASGVYFYRLRAAGEERVRRMTLVK